MEAITAAWFHLLELGSYVETTPGRLWTRVERDLDLRELYRPPTTEQVAGVTELAPTSVDADDAPVDPGAAAADTPATGADDRASRNARRQPRTRRSFDTDPKI